MWWIAFGAILAIAAGFPVQAKNLTGATDENPAPIVLGPYSAASNSVADMIGLQDERPGTWGTSDWVICKITFKPPAGYRVRILRVYGDLTAWARGVVAAGANAGALWALSTTGPEGSVRMDYGADNTFVYIQGVVNDSALRAAFEFDTHVGGLLEPDNVLVSKLAVFLNDTRRTIHLEPTWTMVYQFELDRAEVRLMNQASAESQREAPRPRLTLPRSLQWKQARESER